MRNPSPFTPSPMVTVTQVICNTAPGYTHVTMPHGSQILSVSDVEGGFAVGLLSPCQGNPYYTTRQLYLVPLGGLTDALGENYRYIGRVTHPYNGLPHFVFELLEAKDEF